MCSPRQSRLEELLATMKAQSAEERTRFIERIAAEDPELAAQLTVAAPIRAGARQQAASPYVGELLKWRNKSPEGSVLRRVVEVTAIASLGAAD